MKALFLILSFVFSFSALASKHELSYSEAKFKLERVAFKKSLPVNMIKLYRKIDFDKRMIAGYKETKEKNVSKTGWLDGLRTRLQPTGGKIRL